MNKREEGFTLVELIITMFIFVLILAATSNTFVDLLKDFKKQSKQAETNIEGAVGLEILRRDLESAGYGLPWNVEVDGDGDGNDWEQLVNYCEAATAATTPDPATFNNGKAVTGDCTAIAADPANTVPKAVQSGNNTGVNFSAGAEGSDYLVIKAVNVGINDACQKWTYVSKGNVVKAWTPAGANSDNLETSDRVIVISPGSTDTDSRALVVDGTTFTTRYLEGTNTLNNANFAPSDASEVRIVYGVTSKVTPVDTALRMPFNRADYFIERPAGISSTCAPNTTGVLYKATVNQSDGALNKIPILDCVADMQVVYALDKNEDGEFRDGVGGDAYSDDISELTAKQIRTRVKEIRVYILAQEGQMDMTYTSPTPILVGPDTTLGHTFDLLGTNRNYRWKVYTIVVRPKNLR